ncbi:MAG TPA: MBL fold metallo-hydrolase [Chitinophagaceae bacterium]
MKSKLAAIFLLAIVVGSNITVAQSRVHDSVLTLSGSHMEKIGRSVYAIIHEDPTDQWPTSNTGVIIGEKYVMVIDANYLPSLAKTDIELIKKITSKPVKYLVYTHWHMDHNNGGSVYAEMFPGIEIIAQRMTAEYIVINSPWYAKRETATGSAKRLSLQQMERNFTAGKDTSGKVFTAAELSGMDTIIKKRKNELTEFETLKVIKPNRVFDETLTIDLGNRKVVIKDWGRANSPHDATIYLPADQILFTGDMITQTPQPFTFESWPVSWAKTLKTVEQIPVKVLVPGHGPVHHDHQYTRKLRGLLEGAITQVNELLAQGTPVDQIPSKINLDHLRTGVWDTGINPDPDWRGIINALVDRTIKCVRGQGGIAE